MRNYTWHEIQKQSDAILSCGLNKLKSQPYSDLKNIDENSSGNYLISLNTVPFYIGEGKELAKRLKQQFKPTISTFYKNFQKLISTNQLARPVSIDEFRIQFIKTDIGRKEVEEFGIVNLPTRLNNFQLGKRSKCAIADQNGLWDAIQQDAVRVLKAGESEILNSNFVSWFDTKATRSAGLYLVKDESGALIYIGESSDIGERIVTHSGRTYFSALRRHVGTEILGFDLQVINKKKRYFSDAEDSKVTDYLRTCKVTVFPVAFGRHELEEHLIRKYRPLLNRKDNKD